MSRLSAQLGLPRLPAKYSPVQRYRGLGFPYRKPSTPRGVAVFALYQVVVRGWKQSGRGGT